MLRKLSSLYKNSIIFKKKPEQLSNQVYLFLDEEVSEWLSIPKEDVSEKELNLLKTLYRLVEAPSEITLPQGKAWREFLFFEGPAPYREQQGFYRITQFYTHTNTINPIEVETALKGFFTDEVVIVWENGSSGAVIEEKHLTSPADEEWISMAETMETDFYAVFSFYIGKSLPASKHLREQFLLEKEFFLFGIENLADNKIFTYEKIFPAYLAAHLPEDLKRKVNKEIIEIFKQDPELFLTIKFFLENNLNASLTAKKLYIHRNTLQYRIDKFTENTGISLKDFYGAFTVFLACQLVGQTEQ